MTPSQATAVAKLWPSLIGNYTHALAQAALTADYTDYSESALSLNQACPRVNGTAPPLTSPVFTSRAEFEEGQGSQPPIDSEILNIWPSCENVVLRYNMTNLGTRPVITVIVIEAVRVSTFSRSVRAYLTVIRARKEANIRGSSARRFPSSIRRRGSRI